MRFNPLNLSTPGSTGLYKQTIEEFKGIDKASGEDNFSPTRAKEAQNFIRDKVGTVKKRGGFKKTSDGIGNFVWVDYWKDYRIHYDGSKIHYMKKNQDGKSYSEVIPNYHDFINNTFACAIGYRFADKYVILAKTDGERPMIIVLNNELLAGDVWTFYDNFPLNIKYERYDEEGYLVDYNLRDMMHSDEVLPIPCIVEGAHPNGDGALMRSPNLLCPYVCETFTVSKEDYPNGCERFQLSMKDITLVYDGRIISNDDWSKVEKQEDGTEENGYRTQTKQGSVLKQLGVDVLKNSLKIEVYRADAGKSECYWEDITEDCFKENETGFCNVEKGALWIPLQKIGATPIEGEPNVRITYIRNYDEYKAGLERLFSCNQATSFGVGGYKDRVFLTGLNRIYYSGMDSPLYFGELNYVEPCAADKSIVAMGGEGQVLYAVDSDGITHAISGTTTEDNTATFLSDATFLIADRVQGEKPIGSVLKIFGGEFCYLSEEGVVAIRHDNLYDKRYAQNRSRMLGDSIKGEIIGATVWENFLVIATASQLYLLDELQQTKLADYKYSGVQYEVYPFSFEEKEVNGEIVREIVGEIVKVWTVEGQLHLQTEIKTKNGTKNETTYTEYVYNSAENQTDITAIENQPDITAIWETPFFSLSDEHRLKRIQEFFLSVGAERDAVTIEYQTDNDRTWRTLRTADGRFIGFNYKKLDYGMFNYNSKVEKLQLIVRGRPSRAFRKIRFRFSSKGKYPLSLSSFGFYYKKEVI